MAVELICDNCGQRKVLTALKDGHEWGWLGWTSGHSVHGHDWRIMEPTRCPDCKKAVETARDRAAKEALAIRAVKS